MKRFFVFFGAILLSHSLLAQQISVGIKAGANANNLPITLTGNDIDGTARIDGGTTGFHIGGLVDIGVTANFSVQPNLLFAMKGGGLSTLGKIQLMTIDLPVNLLYKHQGFFIGGGPMLSYGISGKLKPYDKDEDDRDVYDADDWGGNDALLKKFEVGVNLTMGYNFPGGWSLSTNFARGFNNILTNEDLLGGSNNDPKINTRIVGFSIGYTFGKK